MTITLRQESDARASTKGTSLTFQELDNNFIDILNRSELTVEGDSGSAQLSTAATEDRRLVVNGAGGITTSIAADSTGQAVLTLTQGAASVDMQNAVFGTGNITVSSPDSTGAVTIATSAIANVVDDTSPQLGGDLDINSNDITGTGDVNITGTVVAQSTLNAQTGTSYTTVLADASKLVTLSNASAITLTIPANSSVAYPVGTKIDLAQLGAGQVTVAGAGGVTVNATPGLKFIAQYSAATCIKTATDTWLLVGNLGA